MALAHENAKRIEKTRHELTLTTEAKKHLELAMQASHVMAQADNLTEALQRLAGLIVTNLSGTYCRILLATEDGGAIIARAAESASANLQWNPRLEEPVLVEDAPRFDRLRKVGSRAEYFEIWRWKDEQSRHQLGRFSRHLSLTHDLQSLLLVPLSVENRFVGILDEKMAKLNEQEVLARLSQELLKMTRLEGTLNCVVEMAKSALGTEFASIVIAGKDGDLLTHATAGWKKGIAGAFKPGNGKSSHAGYTMLHKSPVRVSDYEEEERFEVPSLVFEEGIRSGLSAPITLDNGVTGALLVQTASQHNFNAEDETLLTLIAGEASMAIQRAQHYEELKRVKGLVEPRSALAWMGMVSAHRHHEINTGVSTINNYLESLRNVSARPGVDKVIPDWIEEYCRIGSDNSVWRRGTGLGGIG
ncbi:MAG: GAF domain-containing protein [Blastocatellia bacterium]